MYPINTDLENTVENLIAQNRQKGVSFYLIIILVLGAILGSLPFIWVDISAQSRGIIRSADENVPIISLVNGKITYIHLRNNQQVNKGDTLLKIDPEIVQSQEELNQNFRTQTLQSIEDYEQMRKSANPVIIQQSIHEEYEKYLQQKRELQAKVDLAEISHRRNKKLFEDRVIASAEYERFLFDLTFAKEALVSFEHQQLAIWEKQKKDLNDALRNYDGTINKLQLEKKSYIITAPISGTIVNYKGFQANSFLGGAVSIAEIAPNNSLVVECLVYPKDIGLVQLGQKVRFDADAFNYHQWGFLTGKVVEIDRNVSIQDKEVFFKVRCQLASTQLKLKNGYIAHVNKGMTLTGRFIITRRNLFQLLYDKADNWLNPVRQKRI